VITAVLCRGVVEPFFSRAAAPHIHPFVNPSAGIRRPSRPRGPDTEYFGATVSRTQASSIRATLADSAGPLGCQAGFCAARASSSCEEGPMHPSLRSCSASYAIIFCLCNSSKNAFRSGVMMPNLSSAFVWLVATDRYGTLPLIKRNPIVKDMLLVRGWRRFLNRRAAGPRGSKGGVSPIPWKGGDSFPRSLSPKPPLTLFRQTAQNTQPNPATFPQFRPHFFQLLAPHTLACVYMCIYVHFLRRTFLTLAKKYNFISLPRKPLQQSEKNSRAKRPPIWYNYVHASTPY
jgi:hypothetical protein